MCPPDRSEPDDLGFGQLKSPPKDREWQVIMTHKLKKEPLF